jgi:ABC-type uncharacterized transport system permease subunit
VVQAALVVQQEQVVQVAQGAQVAVVGAVAVLWGKHWFHQKACHTQITLVAEVAVAVLEHQAPLVV